MSGIKVVPIGTPDVAAKLNFVGALGPSAVWLVVLAMATYVRFHVGRWPIPYDEPSTFAFVALNWLLVAAMWFTWLSLPMWVLTTPWLFLQRRYRLAIARIVLYVLPLVTFLITLNLNTRFSNWLLD